MAVLLYLYINKDTDVQISIPEFLEHREWAFDLANPPETKKYVSNLPPRAIYISRNFTRSEVVLNPRVTYTHLPSLVKAHYLSGSTSGLCKIWKSCQTSCTTCNFIVRDVSFHQYIAYCLLVYVIVKHFPFRQYSLQRGKTVVEKRRISWFSTGIMVRC